MICGDISQRAAPEDVESPNFTAMSVSCSARMMSLTVASSGTGKLI